MALAMQRGLMFVASPKLLHVDLKPYSRGVGLRKIYADVVISEILSKRLC